MLWRLLKIPYKDHVTNEAVRNRIQNAIGVHDESPYQGEEETKMVWPHLNEDKKAMIRNQ